MPTFNVYLPASLRDQMNNVWQQHPDINWSEIAQRAFLFEIERREAKNPHKSHPRLQEGAE